MEGEMDFMINLSLGNISITKIGNSSGLYMGEENIHKKFRSEKTISHVVGAISGNNNMMVGNCWVKNKQKRRYTNP